MIDGNFSIYFTSAAMDRAIAKTLVAAIGWYPLFGVPALIGAGVVWLVSRESLHLTSWDALLVVVPWMLWIALSGSGLRSKSLSNVIVEAIGLGLLVAVLFAIRVWTQYPAWAFLIAASALSAVLWAVVPPLQE